MEFKNGIAKNISPNLDDAFIRAINIKKDQDIRIKVEVIEFDEQIKKILDDAKESFKKLLNSKIVNKIITGITSDTVELISDEFVGSMLNCFTINDLLMKHETVLHFCKTIPNERNIGERYLAEGTLGILRLRFKDDANKKWSKDLTKILSNSFLN